MEDRVISFGGQERAIRLASADGKALQRRFGFVSPASWLVTDLLGIDPATTSNVAGNLEAKQAVLSMALTRAQQKGTRNVTEAQVEVWWDELLDAGESVKPVLWALFGAAHWAGWPTGQRLDVDGDRDMEALKQLFFAKDATELLQRATAASEPRAEPSSSTSQSETPASQRSSVRASDSA